MADVRPRSAEDFSFPLSNHLRVKVYLIWMKRTASIYKNFSLNIIREICEFVVPGPQLAICRAFDLVIFDLLEMRFKVFDISVISQSGTIPPECVCIGDCQVFLCGGGKVRHTHTYSTTAAVYVITGGSAMALSDMGAARHHHGLSYHEPSRLIFAFGGRTPQGLTRSSEQYCIARNSWSPLPDMNEAKDCISACLHQGKVYLCGLSAVYCEMFTIATKQFSLLPMQMSPDSYLCIAVIWEEQLIFIKNSCMRRWSLNTNDFVAKRRLSQRFYSKSVLVVDGTLYVLEQDKFILLDLATDRFLQSQSY